MARMIINILGLSELKWTKMGEFISDDHYIYYCGQEPLKRNRVALIVIKSPKGGSWVQSQKKPEWSLFVSRANHSISQLSKSIPQPLMPKKLNCIVLWRTERPSRTNTPKRRPFHYKDLECKSRKSRNTWRNRQIWPWNTEWSRAKANRVLPRKRTGHSKHPLSTTQEWNI